MSKQDSRGGERKKLQFSERLQQISNGGDRGKQGVAKTCLLKSFLIIFLTIAENFEVKFTLF